MRFFGDVLAGAVTGIVTGFGIGGGTLLILYLTLLEDFHRQKARG